MCRAKGRPVSALLCPIYTVFTSMRSGTLYHLNSGHHHKIKNWQNKSSSKPNTQYTRSIKLSRLMYCLLISGNTFILFRTHYESHVLLNRNDPRCCTKWQSQSSIEQPGLLGDGKSCVGCVSPRQHVVVEHNGVMIIRTDLRRWSPLLDRSP